MTWQGAGGQGDPGGGPSDDETRADWPAVPPTPASSGTPTEGQVPASPPPPPGPPTEPAASPAAPAPPPAPVLPPAAPPAFGAPQPGYGTPPPGHGTTPPGYGAPPGAPVAWAPPQTQYVPTGLEVPGAPGLRFGSVLGRFLAFWLDEILVGIVVGIAAAVLGTLTADSGVGALIYLVLTLGLEFLYFVGMWTSAGRATLGMRVLKLQIGNAFDGRTLTMTQAITRWVALGLPFQALAVIPELAGIAGLASLWALVLLVSTAISPTRQGIHDRLANSAIVQPAGASTPAVACLVLLFLFVVLPIIAIFALIYLGGQVSDILSAVGESV